MPNQIPVNPKLPKNFDDTPNDERSKDELDRWWDHPYCLKDENEDFYTVRCLNGGAWDRSTWLGQAPDYAAACQLAEEKQSAWVATRGQAILSISGTEFGAVILPQRPDRMEQFFPCASKEEAIKKAAELNGESVA